MRSAARKSATPKSDVGRDHADQRHARKVVSLGDHLRTHQHVERPGGHRSENIGRGALAGARCRDPAAPPAPDGHSALISAATRSVPNPRRSRYGPAHAGHAFGTASPNSCSSGSAARVAILALGVDDQRDAAVRAVERAAALPAEHRRRQAAAVQQHQGLLTRPPAAARWRSSAAR